MSLVFNTPKTGLNTTTQCLQNMRSGGGSKLTDVSVEYTENGDYNVEIPEGFDGFSSVEVKVNVMSPAEVWIAPDGISFGWSSIQTVDNIDFRNVQSFQNMFRADGGFRPLTFRAINAKPTNLIYAFYNKGNLDISGIDTSICTSFNYCFGGQNASSSSLNCDIRGLDKFSTDSATEMKGLFSNRYYFPSYILEDISKWNVSKVKEFYYSFNTVGLHNSEPLVFDLGWNTASASNFEYMFSDAKFSYIQAFDATNVNSPSNANIFGSSYSSQCPSCTYFGGLQNCKYGYYVNKMNLLTRDSLNAIIGGLYDYTGTGTTPTTTPIMHLGDTNIAKLTEEDIAVATAKGWTLA